MGQHAKTQVSILKDGCKTVKFKASSVVMSLKAINWLLVRLLYIVYISSKDLDIEDIVCKHEFSYFNATLMRHDRLSWLLPSSNKSFLTHEPESPVTPVSDNSEASTPESIPDRGTAYGQSPTSIIDNMVVMLELSFHKDLTGNYHDLSAFFILATDTKSLLRGLLTT